MPTPHRPVNIISSVDGAQYMDKPIVEALQNICCQRNKSLKLVRKFHPNASIVLFSFCGNANTKMKKGQKIMLCGEPTSTKKCKYAIIVDCKHTPARRLPGAKVVYYPFYAWSFAERFQNVPADLVRKCDAKEIAAKKSKFCAFMYRNSIEHRNNFFDKLSKACGNSKRVDALGKCRHNIPPECGLQIDRTIYIPGVKTYNDTAVQKYRPYKFVLAIENQLNVSGYITEKIVSPMLAGAIPIYWGAQEVSTHFNEKSFINVNKLGMDAAIAEILRIDGDEEAYIAMLSEPWFPNNRLPRFFNSPYLINALAKFVK